MNQTGPYSILEEIESFRRPITVAELARMFGLSRNSVYELIDNGSLPVMKLPGCKKKQFDPIVLAAYYRRYNRHAIPLRKAS